MTTRCDIRHMLRAASVLATTAALLYPGQGFAQTVPGPRGVQTKPSKDETNAVGGATASASDDVVVTGSRVERKGFQAPTPVTVLGPVDLRQGDRPNIVQILNDQTQFRGTTTPTTTPAGTNSGSANVDLRGLGPRRTLTLVNTHRSIAGIDLNSLPVQLIKRVEVVTGGASADWGSGAVAGVVNVILDDSFNGLSVGGSTGIASRGDTQRYNTDLSFGTKFAGDRGHFMGALSYTQELGACCRQGSDRPNLYASLFTDANGKLSLQRDVNVVYATPSGLIQSGPAIGSQFNSNGTISPVQFGNPTVGLYTIGGSTTNTNNYYYITSPYKRWGAFARATFDISPDVRIWAEGNWNHMQDSHPFFPEYAGVVITPDNAYLSPAARAATGNQPFGLGKFLTDIGPEGMFSFGYKRDLVEGAVGIDGSLGGTWKYSIYYDHGEYRDRENPHNQRITANFNNAVDAVISPTTGQPICRIALTDPNTLCRPINLLGTGNVSAAAVAYAFGGATQTTVQKLDAGGISLRGDAFSTWAGPVSVALGFEARRESVTTTYVDPLSTLRAFSLDNRTPLNGSFNVKEGFVEAVVPVLKVEGTAVLDLNGAARYSDYSTSGGIWSWKGGATLQLFNDLRLRGVYSRDIRSPAVPELYSVQTLNNPSIVDPFNNNATVRVNQFTGGNPALRPETSNTLTFGGSLSPRFMPGLSFSVDYYDIDIKDVIGSIGAQDAVNRCKAGYQPACSTIVRDNTGQITTVFSTLFNLAEYKTKGIDFELLYSIPVSRLFGSGSGSFRFRGLATYVSSLIINDGLNTYSRDGDVGDNANFTTPKWRGTGSLTYENGSFSFDTRVRYVGGGLFNHRQPITNNHINSRTYVDLSIQRRFGPLSLYGTVTNLFDRKPPIVTYASAIYDEIGRYFTAGARLTF